MTLTFGSWLAKQLAGEFLEELHEGDFRKGPDYGSPYECRHPEGDHRQNPVYLTSVTCPWLPSSDWGWSAIPTSL